MIVCFAGLPGTGKTTLARALATHLGALVLDKDAVRHALFGLDHTRYTREQDDLCVQLIYTAAAWHLGTDLDATVILDGRTYSRAYQIAQLRDLASTTRHQLLIVECVCPPGVAATRLARDHSAGHHPAGNRTPALRDRLAAAADPIPEPKLLLDTALPVRGNVELILRALPHSPIPSTVEQL